MAKPQDILSQIEKTTNLRLRIELYHLLAASYLESQKTEEAIQSLKTSKELAKLLPEDKRHEVAKIQAGIFTAIGMLFSEEGNLKAAIKIHTEATNILEKLFEKDKQEYFPELAQTYLLLSALSEKTGDFYLAKKNYKAILKLIEKLPEKDRKKEYYKNLSAFAHQQIGDTALNNFQVEEARKELTRALFLYQELVSEKGDEYRPQLTLTLNNLGIACKLNNQYTDAIRYLLAALEQQEILSQQSPREYLPYCAASLNLLGNLYTQKKDIRDEMDGASPFTGFGLLSADQNKKKKRKEEDKKKALEYYQRALEIYRQLSATDQSYLPSVAATLHNLGVLHDEYGEEKEALDYYTQALKLRRKLAAQDPDFFRVDLAITLLNIITLLWSRVENGKSESITQALPLLEEAEVCLSYYEETEGAIGTMKVELEYYQKRFSKAKEEREKA